MPNTIPSISVERFQNVITQSEAQGQDRVSVSNEKRDVQFQRGSRFKLVRWIRDEGFGLSAPKRAENRSAVDAFIGALKAEYGEHTVRGTDAFKKLEDLSQSGKPLRVRHVRTALAETKEKVATQNKQAVDYLDGRINQEITEWCERLEEMDHKGVQELSKEIRGKVNTEVVLQNHSDRREEEHNRGAQLPLPGRDVAKSVERACYDIFLTGYGFETSPKQSPQSDRLQNLLKEHPQVKEYSQVRQEELVSRLELRLKQEVGVLFLSLSKDPQMSKNITAKDRIALEVDKVAKQVVEKYVGESIEVEQCAGRALPDLWAKYS